MPDSPGSPRTGAPAARLTTRALNRATLARQLLLERATLSIAETVERLVGLQAQTTHSWYVGLWSRLEGFDARAASDLLESRELVRLSLMRGTIHLVTARDAWGLRPLMQPAMDRILAGNFARGLKGVDLDELTAVGAAILAETPLSAAKLRALLAPRWPDNDPVALSTAVLLREPVVQVTPRGLWGRSGQTVHTTLGAWLGEPKPAYTLGEVALRYLRAFGPASVADMQAWSGLRGLGEIVDPLRPQLVTFRDEHGRELFDLPDAPRPDPDIPAPPRFLYDYDNVALSHADRTRLISEADRKQALERIGASSFGGVLVDGFFAGLWHLERKADAGAPAVLRVELAKPVAEGERDGLYREAARLLAFLAEDAETREIEFSERGGRDAGQSA